MRISGKGHSFFRGQKGQLFLMILTEHGHALFPGKASGAPGGKLMLCLGAGWEQCLL